MARPRKQEGGDIAALPPPPANVGPGATYAHLFRQQFGARFRFELGPDVTTIRVTAYFGDIGCQKTWVFGFGPSWADEAIATIRDWKAARKAA